jgi:hypothetical protein
MNGSYLNVTYPHLIKTRKPNWIGHILRRHCLLKHNVEGKIDVTGKRDRRHKLLPDDLKETTGYCKLNKEALDCTFWRNRFQRYHRPSVIQNTV